MDHRPLLPQSTLRHNQDNNSKQDKENNNSKAINERRFRRPQTPQRQASPLRNSVTNPMRALIRRSRSPFSRRKTARELIDDIKEKEIRVLQDRNEGNQFEMALGYTKLPYNDEDSPTIVSVSDNSGGVAPSPSRGRALTKRFFQRMSPARKNRDGNQKKQQQKDNSSSYNFEQDGYGTDGSLRSIPAGEDRIGTSSTISSSPHTKHTIDGGFGTSSHRTNRQRSAATVADNSLSSSGGTVPISRQGSMGDGSVKDVQAALRKMEKELKRAKRSGRSVSRHKVMDALLGVVGTLEQEDEPPVGNNSSQSETGAGDGIEGDVLPFRTFEGDTSGRRPISPIGPQIIIRAMPSRDDPTDRYAHNEHADEDDDEDDDMSDDVSDDVSDDGMSSRSGTYDDSRSEGIARVSSEEEDNDDDHDDDSFRSGSFSGTDATRSYVEEELKRPPSLATSLLRSLSRVGLSDNDDDDEYDAEEDILNQTKDTSVDVDGNSFQSRNDSLVQQDKPSSPLRLDTLGKIRSHSRLDDDSVRDEDEDDDETDDDETGDYTNALTHSMETTLDDDATAYTDMVTPKPGSCGVELFAPQRCNFGSSANTSQHNTSRSTAKSQYSKAVPDRTTMTTIQLLNKHWAESDRKKVKMAHMNAKNAMNTSGMSGETADTSTDSSDQVLASKWHALKWLGLEDYDQQDVKKAFDDLLMLNPRQGQEDSQAGSTVDQDTKHELDGVVMLRQRSKSLNAPEHDRHRSGNLSSISSTEHNSNNNNKKKKNQKDEVPKRSRSPPPPRRARSWFRRANKSFRRKRGSGKGATQDVSSPPPTPKGFRGNNKKNSKNKTNNDNDNDNNNDDGAAGMNNDNSMPPTNVVVCDMDGTHDNSRLSLFTFDDQSLTPDRSFSGNSNRRRNAPKTFRA